MIDLSSLPNRTVAVLGLGRSGLAACRALGASRVPVWAWDNDPSARAVAHAGGVPLVDLCRCDLGEAAILVLSPGIAHTHPKPHPVVARARIAGCEIVGDVELLFRAGPNAIHVGITGTNGKSTTTTLIGHVLNTAGLDREVGGNLGTPALELRPLGADGVYVLEMSSYQLELTPSMAFKVAVLLNISADHLDRHGGMDGYIAAKRRIFQGQGPEATAVVGVDDEHGRAIVDDLRRQNGARVIPISGRAPVEGGVYATAGFLFDGLNGEPTRPVLDLSEARALPGEHNAQNAAAAYAAARALGVERARAVEAIRAFNGLAHRQELVDEVAGVSYVNDSKATNADAAARALACYSAIYWIAGGRPKQDGLAAVMPYTDRVRHAFLIGETQDRFAAELDGRLPVTRAGTLSRAFAGAHALANKEAHAGAVVLLSPACASFDQFKNFEDRGDAFRALVKGLRA